MRGGEGYILECLVSLALASGPSLPGRCSASSPRTARVTSWPIPNREVVVWLRALPSHPLPLLPCAASLS